MPDDLYLVGAVGKSLMIAAIPDDIDGDVSARIALQFGLTAADVLIIKLNPGIYELNTFLKHFGVELPTLMSARPEEWGALGLFTPRSEDEQTRSTSKRARQRANSLDKTRPRSKVRPRMANKTRQAKR